MRYRILPWLCLVWALALSTAAYSGTCADFAGPGCRIEIEVSKSFVKKTTEPITRVSIADPDIADVRLITPTQVLLVAKKKPGRTSLIVWHEGKASESERADVYEVIVRVPSNLLQRMNSTLKRLAPGAGVRVVPGNMGLILDGRVESLAMMDRVVSIAKSFVGNLINLVTVQGSQQVQLEVKIAEVSRSGMKQMGLNFMNFRDWNMGIFSGGSFTGTANLTGGGTPARTTTELNPATGVISSTTVAGGAPMQISSLTEVGSPFGAAFQLAFHAVNDDILAILGILKGQGLARMLARPTLVTMTGQEADFLVGGEFPVPVAGESGETNIEFKKFGIMLRFTPTVVGRETITLKVEPEVSNVDYALSVFSGGVAVPGLKTRRGSTTLQLKDGQTFVMAGLLKEETRTVVNKIPLLGDIPILGALFTSKEFQKQETELVIVVTPRLVRALNADEVQPLPGENMNNNVSDLDFFLLNRTESSGTPAEFVGETGFSR